MNFDDEPGRRTAANLLTRLISSPVSIARESEKKRTLLAAALPYESKNATVRVIIRRVAYRRRRDTLPVASVSCSK